MSLLEEYNKKWYYDETSPTGLRWAYTPTRSKIKAKENDPAGYSKEVDGYYILHFHCGEISVHRVIWTLLKGDIPDGMQINHINNDRQDNRICNLEVVTPKENYRKMSCHTGRKKKSHNKSGYTGIRFKIKRKSVEIIAQYAKESNKIQETSFCFKRWDFTSFVERLSEAILWRNQRIKECIDKNFGYPIEASEQSLDLKTASDSFEYVKTTYLLKYGELHETCKR